jgi:hypothetical protein
MGETLLPKRLALPIFCSDPLSSVAPGRGLYARSIHGYVPYVLDSARRRRR